MQEAARRGLISVQDAQARAIGMQAEAAPGIIWDLIKTSILGGAGGGGGALVGRGAAVGLGLGPKAAGTLTGAASGAGADITIQAGEMALGERERFNPLRTALFTGIGGLFGRLTAPKGASAQVAEEGSAAASAQIPAKPAVPPPPRNVEPAAPIAGAGRGPVPSVSGASPAVDDVVASVPQTTPAGSTRVQTTVGNLRRAGLRDAHHVIQDAAVRDLPGYRTESAPGEVLPGPSTKPSTPHFRATQVQAQRGGGTYGAERRIAYKALRAAGFSPDEARAAIQRADEFFASIGVTPQTPTRIPGTRR
jgi:hypothetical protein